jgi:hypothetical protein
MKTHCVLNRDEWFGYEAHIRNANWRKVPAALEHLLATFTQ